MPWTKAGIALVTMMIFGLNAVFSKIGLAEFPPFLFNLLRFSLVVPFLWWIGRPAISWQMLLAIAASLSIGHLSLANIGMYLGASAGTYVLIQQSGSFFAVLFAFILLKHKPTVYDIVGMCLGLVGVYWICSDKGTSGSIWAIAALVGSTMTWALGFTLVKKAHAPSVATTVWTAVFAIPFMVMASASFEGPSLVQASFAEASWLGWSTVAFAAWVSMLGAGSMLMYLMRTEPVSKVVPFNMLVPVFGCLFSALILGEEIQAAKIIGGIWIISGIILTQFGNRLAVLIRSKVHRSIG